MTVENGLTPKTDRYNREFLVKKEDAFKLVLPNEFIYNPMNMTLGAVDLNNLEKKVAVSGYYITMRTQKGFDDNYFAVWLKSPKAIKLYKLYATGGLIEKQRIQFPTLSSIETPLPMHEEQTAIGTFYRNLDNLLIATQRKVTLLKQLKAAYLQQMFPQAGEKVPRVRFEGFVGDWIQRKLGEVADVIAGGDVDKSKLMNDGKYPVIANTLSSDGIVGYYENDYRIEAPAVTVTGRGDVGFAQARKINFTPVVRLLSVKSNFDVDFLANAINQFDIFVESTGVPQLTSPQLMNYEIIYPDIKEQTTIGSFLYNLEIQVKTQSEIIEKLRELKSTYLQKMFV